MLFNVSGDTYSFLHRRCPSIGFCSRTDPFVRFFSSGDHLNGGQGVCTRLQGSTMSMCNCRHKHLLLTGSFRYEDAPSHICCLLCV